MNDVTKRYLELINALISQSLVKDNKDFAVKVEVSVSSITEIVKGRTNIGLSAIQKTIKRYPLLNLDWLLSGDGDIFKTKYEENVVK